MSPGSPSDPARATGGTGGAGALADDEGDGPGNDPVAEAFLAGGPDALRAVYDAHAGLVFAFCRRSLGHERAADATQEVFTDVWRNRHRYDPTQGTLRGWVMGIARFKVLGALRSEGTRPGPSAAAEHLSSTGSADVDIESIADRMTLAQALGGLPDRNRRLIRLAYLDGLSHTEIAQRTGLPLGSVKSDIRRGLTRLRSELGGPT